MHYVKYTWLAAVLLAISSLPAAEKPGKAVERGSQVTADPEYVRAIEEWRGRRLSSLTSETGWLTLIALHWLEEGENTFGRARANSFALDHPAVSDAAGSFFLERGRVRFVASPGSAVTHEGKAITTLDLATDTSGDPTILALGTLRLFVIERAGRIGIRVRDIDHSLRRQFAGLEYFPVRGDWVIEARFEPYPVGRTLPIMNVLGFEDRFIAPGALVFEKDGRELRLDAVLESRGADELFILFADATSGRETYGAGRFLYVPLPREGKVLLDFNRSYNPPCAFNEFATCPLPPRQNRLPIAVEAGELKHGVH